MATKLFSKAGFFGVALAVTGALGAVAQASAAPTETQVWREAYQSSPAHYDPLAPEFIKMLVEKFKMPPEAVEQMRPQTASGTQRVRLAVSARGPQIRIRISNEEGTDPLVLAAASVGLAGEGYVSKSGTLKSITFGGRRSVSVPVGAPVLSDPITLPVAPGTELIVSTYATGSFKLDPLGGGTVVVAAGDQTMKNELAGGTPMVGRPAVTGVAVLSPPSRRVIATLGDSITDGNRPALTETRSWPEALASRLAARRSGGDYAVVNAGIGGNRVLGSGWGPSALARLDRDVLRIDGLSHLIVLEGSNDIGMSGHAVFGNHPVVTPEDLIAGYRQIIARAHARGVQVIIGTIMPFGSSMTHYSPGNERTRQAVNRWIRTSREADGVIDFDQVARDPANPVNMRAEFGSEDGLHPGAAGYVAMGEAVDLSVFK
ncbi:lysophospholipase L1-like esterase [Luteibacter jiangsuensis]|uniref:Lysophospholipase L1-like esterase n=1 Tax=Luteibacter jiangsuensis TaxID=637577 RepID=A0ABT9STX8_9GAMM|nr:SGNH/GDSL hydrolase family protein [Luteibacter jiangsuensis]MDQ0008245.1 lysophospholipase L1-like esterase [Luteibacter jiangsuensis]